MQCLHHNDRSRRNTRLSTCCKSLYERAISLVVIVVLVVFGLSNVVGIAVVVVVVVESDNK